jgi:hypothetical protein
VRQKLAEIDYRLRRCIYAHPVDGRTLSIRYPDAELGRRLVVHTGIDNYDARLKARRAVYHRYHGRPKQRGHGPLRRVGIRLTVKADGRVLGTITKKLTDTWDRHVLDTTRWAGKRAKVAFEISTRWAYSKPFCFHARAEH